MKQKDLYEPIKAWLQTRGVRALISGTQMTMVLPISDLISMPYKVPDLIGVDGQSHVVIIEVEKDKKRFFDALGRCSLWKCMAKFVYMAFPKGEIIRAPFLKKLGIGLLEVETEAGQVEGMVELPTEGSGSFQVSELHPLDFSKEQQLAKHITNILSGV